MLILQTKRIRPFIVQAGSVGLLPVPQSCWHGFVGWVSSTSARFMFFPLLESISNSRLSSFHSPGSYVVVRIIEEIFYSNESRWYCRCRHYLHIAPLSVRGQHKRLSCAPYCSLRLAGRSTGREVTMEMLAAVRHFSR